MCKCLEASRAWRLSWSSEEPLWGLDTYEDGNLAALCASSRGKEVGGERLDGEHRLGGFLEILVRPTEDPILN